MSVDLVPVWNSAPEEFFSHRTAIVIDVLRATTTIAHAVAQGAAGIMPVCEVQEAYAQRERHPDWLLGGERDGVAPQGFDLGNSPLEYTSLRVRDRTIVLTTTNGTMAMQRARLAERIVSGAIVNAGVVAQAVAADQDVVFLLSGTHGAFSLEDFVGAGAIAAQLGRDAEWDDAVRAAVALYRAHEDDLASLLLSGQHGAYIAAIGFAKDVQVAAQVDSCPVLAVLEEDILRRKA